MVMKEGHIKYSFRVKWSNVTRTKEHGGWGLNNIYLFGKSLREKVCGTSYAWMDYESKS